MQPPPLEPMPFAAAEQKSAKATQKAEQPSFPKPAPPIVLPSATAKQPVIGPPKPNAAKAAPAVVQADPVLPAGEKTTGRPSYVDRDLTEFPLFLNELPKVCVCCVLIICFTCGLPTKGTLK